MSGLEPLAALRLACNIRQLVECAAKTVKMYKAVYSGEPPNDELLARNKFIKLRAQEAKAMCTD